MCNKLNDLRNFINSSNYSLIALSETWLNPDMTDDFLKVEDYTFLRCDRTGRGGGVGLYILEKLKPKKLDVIDFNNGIDQLWVRFKCKKLSVVVGVVYRPPSVPCNALLCLYEILPEIVSSCDVCICTGDFNINFICKTATEHKMFTDLLSSFNLAQLITVPTRLTNDSESIIDLININRVDLVLKCGVISCSPIVTDHEAVFCSIDCSVPSTNVKYKEFRNLSVVDPCRFEEDLRAVDWHAVYNDNDINSKVSTFNHMLIDTFDKHCPIQKIKAGKPKPPWLTYTLKK